METSTFRFWVNSCRHNPFKDRAEFVVSIEAKGLQYTSFTRCGQRIHVRALPDEARKWIREKVKEFALIPSSVIPGYVGLEGTGYSLIVLDPQADNSYKGIIICGIEEKTEDHQIFCRIREVSRVPQRKDGEPV